jgi:hypothetical protein
MSKIKNFYHDEICKEIDDHIDNEYFYNMYIEQQINEMYDAQTEEQEFLDLTYSQGILPA